jgi:formylmethanofuran dehydrogenase subunit B
MHASTIVRVPFCGLPCSALRIDAAGAGAWSVAGGCSVARAAAAPPPPSGPRAAGRPADLETALARAAALLAGARRPRVAGLAWSTIGSARRAVRLARRIGASIDIEGGDAVAAESEAIAIAGLTSATFGAVRARADVVLLWRCDPRDEHPDLLPARLPAAAGGGERRFVRLGTPDAAGEGDLEALAALRALVLGRAAHLAPAVAGPHAGGVRVRPAPAGDIPLGALREAAAALSAAHHAAIVWDARAVRGPAGPAVALALALLARDLDDGHPTGAASVTESNDPGAPGRRRAVARSLGGGGDIAGALSAVLSEAGHARRLDHGEAADVALLVGARERLTEAGAVVAIGARTPRRLDEPDVFLPAAVPGLSGEGLWMRADGIAVPVREAVPRTAPLEEEMLDALLERLPEAAR